jgi:hypothetical protein
MAHKGGQRMHVEPTSLRHPCSTHNSNTAEIILSQAALLLAQVAEAVVAVLELVDQGRV